MDLKLLKIKKIFESKKSFFDQRSKHLRNEEEINNSWMKRLILDKIWKMSKVEIIPWNTLLFKRAPSKDQLYWMEGHDQQTSIMKMPQKLKFFIVKMRLIIRTGQINKTVIWWSFHSQKTKSWPPSDCLRDCDHEL